MVRRGDYLEYGSLLLLYPQSKRQNRLDDLSASFRADLRYCRLRKRSKPPQSK
jgi:hypothetical protein